METLNLVIFAALPSSSEVISWIFYIAEKSQIMYQNSFNTSGLWQSLMSDRALLGSCNQKIAIYSQLLQMRFNATKVIEEPGIFPKSQWMDDANHFSKQSFQVSFFINKPTSSAHVLGGKRTGWT